MGTKMVSKGQEQPVNKAAANHNGGFDFDQWAVQVKRQMIASLHRRGVR